MKRLILTIALVLVASTSFAWTLNWQPLAGAAGYRVSYKTLAATTYTQVDTLAVASLNLDGLSLVQGTRYEFLVQGYAGTPKSYSGESDHIRWTMPTPPIVVETLGQPVQINIVP